MAWVIASTCYSLKLESNELPAMAGGAEGHALGADGRIRAFAVIRGDQPRNIHQPIRRRRLAGERVDSRTHDVASAALLSAMLCISSVQDLTVVMSHLEVG